MLARFAFALFTALAASAALACPICASGPALTPAQQLIGAERVLIVKPQRDAWKAVAVIKGPSGEIPAGVLQPPKEVGTTGPLVVTQDKVSKRWGVVGPLGPEHADWLGKVAASKRASEMTDADWRERVAFYLPYLEHADPFIAETAYGEIARAPYAAMRTLKPRLDARKLGRWLDDSVLAPRAPLYTLLLGIAGGPDAAARIDRALADAAKKHDVSNLAALLGADLELRGPARLAWVERTYLTTPERTAQEIQAVLLALSVQGGADAAIPRARIVDTYRTFIRSHHPLAGYPAPDLLGWQAWEAVPDYLALIRLGAPQHPASELALLHYLDSSPRTDAKAAVAAYRASRR